MKKCSIEIQVHTASSQSTARTMRTNMPAVLVGERRLHHHPMVLTASQSPKGLKVAELQGASQGTPARLPKRKYRPKQDLRRPGSLSIASLRQGSHAHER